MTRIHNQIFVLKVLNLMELIVVLNLDGVFVVAEDEMNIFLYHFDLNELIVEVMIGKILMEFQHLYL